MAVIDGYLVGPNVDLSGADLSGADLTGLNVSRSTMNGTKLDGATLQGITGFLIVGSPASLPAGWHLEGGALFGPGADLSNSYLLAFPEGVDLSHTNLSHASLPNDLRGDNFTGADLTGVDLSQSDLTDAVFTGATGSPTIFLGESPPQPSRTVFNNTTCIDGQVVSAPYTCLAHGFTKYG
jgi:uncharacterized protein YjbI with pentapeptide repeats